LQLFFQWLPNPPNLPSESRVPTLSGIACASCKLPSKRLRAEAPTPASTTSPNRRASDRELCIATSLHGTRSSRRSIGLLYESSRGQIQGAIEALAKRAIQSGDLRSDLDPFDLLRALIGVSYVASSPDWPQSAKRLVDILIAGSRPAK